MKKLYKILFFKFCILLVLNNFSMENSSAHKLFEQKYAEVKDFLKELENKDTTFKNAVWTVTRYAYLLGKYEDEKITYFAVTKENGIGRLVQNKKNKSYSWEYFFKSGECTVADEKVLESVEWDFKTNFDSYTDDYSWAIERNRQE